MGNCFDFPQSGTGYCLHPNEQIENNHKTKGIIIPDIVAVKLNKCLFFENKDRFALSDFLKINKLITKKNYSDSIDKLLNEFEVNEVFYGIGLPSKKITEAQKQQNHHLVNFIVSVTEEFSIEILKNWS